MNNVDFCEFDMLRGDRKGSWTEWRTFCCSSKGKRSSHQWSDQKTHVLLASWTVRAESLGILKEWRGRRYRGWSRWRRLPRKSWWEGYQKLMSLLSMIEVPTDGRPHGQKQETEECEMGPSQQEMPSELQRNCGRGRMWPPSDVHRQGVSCLDRTVALVAEDEMANKENVSPCSSASEHSSRLSLEVVVDARVALHLEPKLGRAPFLPWIHWKAIFAVRLVFPVISHNSRYAENSGFLNSIIIERA